MWPTTVVMPPERLVQPFGCDSRENNQSVRTGFRSRSSHYSSQLYTAMLIYFTFGVISILVVPIQSAVPIRLNGTNPLIDYAFNLNLLDPSLNVKSNPRKHIIIVPASTFFVRKSANISVVTFFPNAIRPSVITAWTHRKTVSMCLTRPRPRLLPMAMPVVASIQMRLPNFHPQSARMLCSPSAEDAALTRP